MNVLVDSSTLYSAIAHSGKVAALIDIVIERHTIVMSDYIIEELSRNLSKKLREKVRKRALDRLELFVSNAIVRDRDDYIEHLREAMQLISKKDAPILACAMLPDVDVLLASDKEFLDIECDRVVII